MTINSRTVDDLKSAGHMFVAGALAHSLGRQQASYGCHFGMRSTLEADRATFARGWQAAAAALRGA